MLFFSCQEQDRSGHLHEYVKGQYSHCYIVTDSSITVDYLLHENVTEIEKKDGKILLRSEANRGAIWTADYIVKPDIIHFNDTIKWLKVEDNEKTFLSDLSSGLLLSIVPDTLDKTRFSKRTWRSSVPVHYIYIGKLKEQFKNKPNTSNYNYDGFYIQVNDVLIEPKDIPDFVVRAHDLENQMMVVIHADTSTPEVLMDSLHYLVLNAGYSDSNIYKTVVDKQNRAVGISRIK